MTEHSVIRVLDETTANKIAAGEVVERPASVVKELVENSIDARSSQIEIEIRNGGVDLIRVSDNGIGMSSADAELAILRHATSKIVCAEDLTSIRSLGFRGEALPSIASVSKFKLSTRLHQATMATFLAVDGGQVREVREAGSNVGTTVIVTELFFNTPARQKFLKTPATESGYIGNILTKLALSHPEIAFRFINNNKLVFSTPGNKRLDDVIASLYGHKVAAEILPMHYEDSGITVAGYVSKPSILKSNRGWQTFIVNSRVIQSRFIAKAVDNAYHSLLPKVGYPLVVLEMDIPADAIDVNVHPQKSEVKFSNEQMIFRLAHRAVSDALRQATQRLQSVAPNIDLSSRKELKDVCESQRPHNNNFSTIIEQNNLWRSNDALSPSNVGLPAFRESRQVSGHDQYKHRITIDEIAYQEISETQFQPLGQIEDCFIIARGEDGLYIIDQHAAHERILYDRMARESSRISVQQLLTPIFMELDSAERDIVEKESEIFHNLGFSLDQIGPDTIRIMEVPADIPTSEAENIVREILGNLRSLHNPTPGELRHACLQTAACRAAIKAGDNLNMRQMKALIEELFNTDLPFTCPHGRPAIVKFSGKELAKLFKRT